MVVSAVGRDKLGKEILDSLSEKNLNMLIEEVQHPTRTVQVELDNDGIPCYDINLRQKFYTKEILCRSMEQCNILKINDEELATVSRLFGYPDIDFQDRCRRLLHCRIRFGTIKEGICS